MREWQRAHQTIAVFSVFVIAGLGIGIGTLLKRDTSVLPVAAIKDITFQPFIPRDEIQLKTGSVSYNAAQRTLSYDVTTPAAKTVTITQQETPSQFVDIEGYENKFYQSLSPTDQFENSFGRITIFQPKELGGANAAVVNSKGVLLFARSRTFMTKPEWQKFFTDLTQRDL